MLRLQPDDLRHRFMGARQRLFVGRYVRSIDWHKAVIVGCFVGRSLRGVAELHPIGGHRGEIALSVERRFQRIGVGSELLRRLLLLARNRGLVDLELRCMAENYRVRRLVRRFEGSVELSAAEATGTIRPLPATAATIASEMVERAGLVGTSMIRFWLDRSARAPVSSWVTPDLFARPPKTNLRARVPVPDPLPPAADR